MEAGKAAPTLHIPFQKPRWISGSSPPSKSISQKHHFLDKAVDTSPSPDTDRGTVLA